MAQNLSDMWHSTFDSSCLWTEALSSMIFVAAKKLSGIVRTKPLFLLELQNTVEPPGTSPFRGHFYSGDTSLEPEGVPWIEVSLYSDKQEQGGKSSVRRDPNFPVDCKQFLGIVARRASYVRTSEANAQSLVRLHVRCSPARKSRRTAFILASPLHAILSNVGQERVTNH